MTANSKQQTAKASNSPAQESAFGGAYSFRNLAMWQRAQDLTSEILDAVAKFPSDRVTSILTQQVIRSSSSIAANIAEGHGRFAAGSYRNHLSIARGSTAETISWLDLMHRRRLLTAEAERSALAKCAELMKMLTAKMIQLDKQTKTDRSFRDERTEYEV